MHSNTDEPVEVFGGKRRSDSSTIVRLTVWEQYMQLNNLYIFHIHLWNKYRLCDAWKNGKTLGKPSICKEYEFQSQERSTPISDDNN